MNIDLAVYDRFQRLVLAVEAKKKFGVSERWARKTREDLVTQGFYPTNSYFLLATPEKFFLWLPENNALEETKPDFVVNGEKQLKPYLDELHFNLRKIDSYTFEQVLTLIAILILLHF